MNCLAPHSAIETPKASCAPKPLQFDVREYKLHAPMLLAANIFPLCSVVIPDCAIAIGVSISASYLLSSTLSDKTVGTNPTAHSSILRSVDVP